MAHALGTSATARKGSMKHINDAIRQFILTTYLPGESPENLRDDTPLQTSGILDSLAVLGLVSFVAKEFDIELDVYDTSVERFNRIEDIAASVVRKRAAAERRFDDPVS
jgi:acyl carrier protein